ncbi:MAG: T9SS type A sorting domain-containing protein [Bacteroidota bacterium]
MNRRFYKFLFLLPLICLVAMVQTDAQVRYLDEVATNVMVENDIIYGQNLTVLRQMPNDTVQLRMDVYRPVGDSLTNRPVVIYFHTGSFLPPLFNGGITGARTDSTVLEFCRRFARLGYVAIAASYRAGWNPTATGSSGQNIRTGTLLNAAYRGIQDARTCIRFLRKSVAEENNPYGIDPDKIVLWGQGTGGYISFGSAFLDRFEEVVLPKFIDSDLLVPYVDTTLVGNVLASTNKPLCIANHVGYSSDFAMAINMGGALGDISWIDGGGNEPPTIGFHVVRDPFAPFADGPVIVPTTGDFVVNVSGTRSVVEKVNDSGVNDVLAPASALTNTLNSLVSNYKNVPVVFPSDTTTLATDHMYPFITNGPEAGPWDWWNKDQLDLIVAGTNQALMTDFNSDTLHRDGLLTNPDMSAEKGRAHIDTIMSYYIPRGCLALGLTDCIEALGLTNTQEILEVGLTMMPNPATDRVQFFTTEAPIQGIRLYDVSGKLMQDVRNINDYAYDLYRYDLPPGMYVAQLRFKEGTISRKIMFK